MNDYIHKLNLIIIGIKIYFWQIYIEKKGVIKDNIYSNSDVYFCLIINTSSPELMINEYIDKYKYKHSYL